VQANIFFVSFCAAKQRLQLTSYRKKLRRGGFNGGSDTACW